jgi:hypothetical protein
MNNENALEGLGLLNPFDALYRSVFKYTPSQYFGGSKPYTKNAYTNAVLSNEEVGIINSIRDKNNRPAYRYPSIFQAALPGGMATADRVGPVVKFNGSFLDEGITVGVKAAALSTYVERADGIKPQYQEAVGGAGLDVAKFAPVVGPSLHIGASYGIYNVIQGDIRNDNSLISFGLDYSFIPRFSVLLGYQLLGSYDPGFETWSRSSDDGIPDNMSRIDYVVKRDYEFSNFSFGLSYKVADGGILTAKISALSGKNILSENSTYTEHYKNVDIDGNTPDPATRPYGVKGYTALQPEVYLTVKF